MRKTDDARYAGYPVRHVIRGVFERLDELLPDWYKVGGYALQRAVSHAVRGALEQHLASLGDDVVTGVDAGRVEVIVRVTHPSGARAFDRVVITEVIDGSRPVGSVASGLTKRLRDLADGVDITALLRGVTPTERGDSA